MMGILWRHIPLETESAKLSTERRQVKEGAEFENRETRYLDVTRYLNSTNS